MIGQRAIAITFVGALAALLVGCAAPPPPRPLPVAPVDDRPPLAGSPVPPPEPAEQGPWTAALQDVARRMQQAALQQGSVSVDRTLDDRLFIRLPVAAAFDSSGLLSHKVEPFLAALAEALTRHTDVAASIAENPVRGASARGPKAQPRVGSMMRFLLIRGVAAGQLSIDPAGRHQAALPSAEREPSAERQIEFLLSAHGR